MEKHIIQFFKFLQDKEGKPVPLKLEILDPQTFGEPTKEQLKVKGTLGLSKTDIKELPEGLEVDGHLILIKCKSLKKLPEGLKVRGDLWLDDCRSLKELPKGLEVVGNLYLENTPIAKKYSEKEVRKMIEDGGGFVKREIYIQWKNI